MERDLDDDVPEAFADYDDDDEEEDFDNQPDLDDEIPSPDEGADEMSEFEQEEEHEERDLDDDIPEADAGEEEEWQHTDTDAEFDDEEDVSFSQHPFRTSTASSTRGPPLPQAPVRPRETEAQRRFLQRWSGGGDVFDTSSLSTSMLVDELDQEHVRDRNRDYGRDLRASLASQTSRRSSGNGSIFGRFPRRRGRSGMPRDSLEF
ncbi:hypothetical protein BDW68DRAFT_162774 [Aspergillus falconensis]